MVALITWVGRLVRDFSGSWLCGFYVGFLDGDPLLAENLAMRMGLLMAWEKNFRRILCCSDYFELVNMLRKNQFDFHVYGNHLLDLHLFLSRTWEVRIQHVPPEANAPSYGLLGRSRHAVSMCYDDFSDSS